MCPGVHILAEPKGLNLFDDIRLKVGDVGTPFGVQTPESKVESGKTRWSGLDIEEDGRKVHPVTSLLVLVSDREGEELSGGVTGALTEP